MMGRDLGATARLGDTRHDSAPNDEAVARLQAAAAVVQAAPVTRVYLPWVIGMAAGIITHYRE